MKIVNIKKLGISLSLSQKVFNNLKTFRIYDDTNKFLHIAKSIKLDNNGDVILIINENLFEERNK